MITFEELQERIGSQDKKDWHKHKNGGGWIHKDAIVDDEAYVGENAIVWKFYQSRDTRVGKDAILREGVFRGGEFWGGEFWGGVFRGGVFWGGVFRGGVFWGGEFWGGEFWGGEFWGGVFRGGEFWGGVFRGGVFDDPKLKWEKSPLFIQGSKHTACDVKPGHIQIGCHCATIEWWESKEGPRFGESNGYTPEEVAEYQSYIALFRKRHDAIQKAKGKK